MDNNCFRKLKICTFNFIKYICCISLPEPEIDDSKKYDDITIDISELIEYSSYSKVSDSIIEGYV